MDRAAKLAAEARDCLRLERESGIHWKAAREATRQCLAEAANDLGFAHNEISAAVDEALTAAGTTP
jgi:hypothetical protein